MKTEVDTKSIGEVAPTDFLQLLLEIKEQKIDPTTIITLDTLFPGYTSLNLPREDIYSMLLFINQIHNPNGFYYRKLIHRNMHSANAFEWTRKAYKQIFSLSLYFVKYYPNDNRAPDFLDQLKNDHVQMIVKAAFRGNRNFLKNYLLKHMNSNIPFPILDAILNKLAKQKQIFPARADQLDLSIALCRAKRATDAEVLQLVYDQKLSDASHKVIMLDISKAWSQLLRAEKNPLVVKFFRHKSLVKDYQKRIDLMLYYLMKLFDFSNFTNFQQRLPDLKSQNVELHPDIIFFMLRTAQIKLKSTPDKSAESQTRQILAQLNTLHSTAAPTIGQIAQLPTISWNRLFIKNFSLIIVELEAETKLPSELIHIIGAYLSDNPRMITKQVQRLRRWLTRHFTQLLSLIKDQNLRPFENFDLIPSFILVFLARHFNLLCKQLLYCSDDFNQYFTLNMIQPLLSEHGEHPTSYLAPLTYDKFNKFHTGKLEAKKTNLFDLILREIGHLVITMNTRACLNIVGIRQELRNLEIALEILLTQHAVKITQPLLFQAARLGNRKTLELIITAATGNTEQKIVSQAIESGELLKTSFSEAAFHNNWDAAIVLLGLPQCGIDFTIDGRKPLRWLVTRAPDKILIDDFKGISKVIELWIGRNPSALTLELIEEVKNSAPPPILASLKLRQEIGTPPSRNPTTIFNTINSTTTGSSISISGPPQPPSLQG